MMKKMNQFLLLGLMSCSILASTQNCLDAQNIEDGVAQQASLQETILSLDAKFWSAYNTCDLESYETFFTADLEFYHDKGGLTTPLSKLMEQTRNYRCSENNKRLRRESKVGTIQVFPLQNYGAIISGEHFFYQQENDKEETLIEQAKFLHVWHFNEDQWKMTRVISYDHEPVSENIFKDQIEVPDEILRDYIGKYRGPDTDNIEITLEGSTLKINAGNGPQDIFPESRTLFFSKKRPLTFEFINNNDGKTIKMIVRENNQIVEEAAKID